MADVSPMSPADDLTRRVAFLLADAENTLFGAPLSDRPLKERLGQVLAEAMSAPAAITAETYSVLYRLHETEQAA